MNAAAIQFKPVHGALAHNRSRLVALAERAASQAHLVVLPEMCTAGYVFTSKDQARRVCEPARGPTLAALAPIARRHRCTVVAGYAESAGEALFNSALVINPDGELAFNYRKTLLYDVDRVWALPGDSGYIAFDAPNVGKVGLGICMDLNDPRFLLWLWRMQVDVLAFPTNWVEEGLDVHRYWFERLHGSGVTLVAANTYGEEAGIRFSGRSAVLRRGRVLASADRTGDAVVVAPLGARKAV